MNWFVWVMDRILPKPTCGLREEIQAENLARLRKGYTHRAK